MVEITVSIHLNYKSDTVITFIGIRKYLLNLDPVI